MMKNLLGTAVFIAMLVPVSLLAQDARFSQYFNNPLVLNPAFAGNGIEYIRVTAIYRNQWAGMGTPFTTQGFAVDKVVNRVGFGAVITRNGAGEASIKTINAVGTLSYHLPLGYEKTHHLSAGIQVGINNKSFDQSKLTFDNQYNPDQGYDPNMSSGEEFSTTSVTRPDVNVGLSWQRGWLNKEIRFKPFLGISYSHITQPDETFIMDATKLHARSTVYGGAGFMVKERTEIKPSFMLLQQGPSRETTFGTLVNYQLDNKNAVQLGAYHRMNDAVIAYAGYQMNQLFVGMSYDVNTSELSKSGKGNNAFEISLTYSPRPKRKKEPEPKKKVTPKPAAEALSPMEPVGIPEVYVFIPEVLSFVALPDMTPATHENVETVSTPSQEHDEAPQTQPTVEPATKPEQEAISAPSREHDEAPQTQAIVEPATKPVQAETIVEPAIAVAAPVTIPETAPVVKDFDADGVADADDECPYIKGSVHTKGCPDSDSDGIVDMHDDCPMESGPATNKGCPDPNKPVMANNQELVQKYNNVLFNTGSTSMTTDDIFDIIESAIDIMYADKSTKVILSGHTDSEGDAYHNMILSQARANVVMNYMIRQGIDPSRIETVAYGETMPLDSNNTTGGKKQNRRVEINILRK